ncbi:HD-GYP domain-containing protein [Paenibacillus sp. MBLB4367]|uniref:HD-GYP domain-containing protein n=1 Tax=Paenibacillus sp. MBLB4367 TaxID=3384767 RepID=UPI003907ED5F
MRLLPIQHCGKGMILGKSVYLNGKSLLIREGTVLTETSLNKLARIGIQVLHIRENAQDSARTDSARYKETMHALEMLLAGVYDRLYRDRSTDGLAEMLDNCRDAVEKLSNVLLNGQRMFKPFVWAAMTLDSRKRHFIENALHVCVNTITFGLRSGCVGGELYALGLGALLHDLGSLRFTCDSNRHPQEGYTLLKHFGLMHLTAIAVLQHHERIDGSGYPLGLKEGMIDPFARWIGLIDYFDVLVHGRGGECPMPRHEVVELLYSCAGSLFDLADVRRFCSHLELFPPGSNVRLSSGEYAIVTDVDKHLLRPVVRVIRNARGETLRRTHEIDLSQELHLVIESIDQTETSAYRAEEMLELALVASR